MDGGSPCRLSIIRNSISLCRPVEFKKSSCSHIRKVPCPMTQSYLISWCMSLRPRKTAEEIRINFRNNNNSFSLLDIDLSKQKGYTDLFEVTHNAPPPLPIHISFIPTCSRLKFGYLRCEDKHSYTLHIW